MSNEMKQAGGGGGATIARKSSSRGHSNDGNTPQTPTTSPSNAPFDQSKTKQLGFGDQFPANLLEEKTVELRYKEKARKVGLIVSKSLLVINIYSSAFAGRIFNGDFIIKVNDQPALKKAAVYEALETFLRNHEKFTLTVKRPKWLTPTTNVPKGYDLAPGYEYFSGLLVLYPNSTVGLNVKAFSSRVYVVRVEGDSIAVNTCLVGDCIVDIAGYPITTVTECSEKIVKALKEKKYVMLTIERSATPVTIRAVRCALFAEKTTPMDPRLATDTQKIGEQEAAKIKAGKVPEAGKGILKLRGQGVTGVSFYGTEKPHMEVRLHSEEITIGCEPYNPLFFQKVKPKQSAADTPPNKPANSLGTASQSISNGTNNTMSVANTQTEKGSKEKISISSRKLLNKPQMSAARTKTKSKDDDSKRATGGGGGGGSGKLRQTGNSGPSKSKDDDSKRATGGKKDDSKRGMAGIGNIFKKKAAAQTPTSGGDIGLDGPAANGTDMENSLRGKKDDDSKRMSSGKVMKSMYGSTPQTPTTAAASSTADNEKSDRSLRGLRGKTMAALKSVANMKPKTGGGDSQRKK